MSYGFPRSFGGQRVSLVEGIKGQLHAENFIIFFFFFDRPRKLF